MGLVHYLKDKLQAVVFLVRTGMSRSSAQKVLSDLSNLYLTPASPGRLKLEGRDVTIITSTGRMSVRFDKDEPFLIDRSALRVGVRVSLAPWYDHIEDAPFWDKGARPVLDLVRTLAYGGIPLKPNTAGVTYYHMPGEGEA